MKRHPKQNKKRYKEPQHAEEHSAHLGAPRVVELKCTRRMANEIAIFSIMGGIFLCVGLLLCFFADEGDNDLALFAVVFTGPLVLVSINFIALFCAYKKDWAKASEEGLEFHLHNSLFCLSEPINELIPWEKISQFASIETQDKREGVTCRLLLRLEGEKNTRIYHANHLQGQGHPLVLAATKFKQQPASKELEQEQEEEERENYIDYLLIGGMIIGILSLIASITLYEHTLIKYWFYLPFYLVFGASIIGVCCFSKRKLRGILTSFILFCFSILTFLLINYRIADWDKADEIRTFDVIKACYTKAKNGSITGYNLTISTENGNKDIEFGLHQDFDLREAKTLDLHLHKGFFGFPVYKEKVPHKGQQRH